jgi:HAD superfamily phosphoserine phosphatase-like hydrolase
MSARMDEIKHICLDLNKTLIKENTWLELNRAMGMSNEEDQMLLDLGVEGIISYAEAQSIISRIYMNRGKAYRKNIEDVIFNYTFIESAKETVQYLQESGYTVSLITAAFQSLADRVGEELGIEMRSGNNILIFDEHDYLESLVVIGDENLWKMRELENFCRKLGIEVTETACIGDGDNEYLMFERCEHGVTFKGSPIEDEAWKVINRFQDLKDIF